jgi:uncharacterized membrane protein
MKTNRLATRSKKRRLEPNRWLLAVLIVFVVLIIIGLVLFFLFPNKAI